MKDFLKIFFSAALFFFCVGNACAAIISYKILYAGSVSCRMNFEVVSMAHCAPFASLRDDGIGTYNTDTKTLSADMFELGPHNQEVIFDIPFVNNVAYHVGACFSSLSGEPVAMSDCQNDPTGLNTAMYIDATYDPTNNNINVQQMETTFRGGPAGMLSLRVVNSVLAPTQ